MARVLVAMSGGVDSAVAAMLLRDQGHDVTAVHLEMAHVPEDQQVVGHGCCTIDDAADARRVAQVLGLDFYVWNFRERFATTVQEPFVRDYAAGRTPNPCVVCNEQVKYAALLERAVTLGFDALATGHHAKLRRRDAAGVWQPVTEPGDGAVLHRSAEHRKDQSYVMHASTPWQLARTLLPVGEHTKAEVRRLADDGGLRVSHKPDSHDICFIPDGDTAAHLARHLPVIAGDVVDTAGLVIGRHDGIWNFTIGQRRGLGLGTHERRFVVDLEATANRVVVGTRDELARDRITTVAPSWAVADPAPLIAGARVQIRAHGSTVGASAVTVGADGGLVIDLSEPLHGVAPGQSLVLYDADDRICLGGARIVSSAWTGS